MTDLERYEANIREAQDEYAATLNAIRSGSVSTHNVQSAIDDLNRAQAVVSYYSHLREVEQSRIDRIGVARN